MSKKLHVYLNSEHVGELEQNKHGQMTFRYIPEWLNSSLAFPISCSLPMREETFTEKECRPFFAGILPEDTARKLIAKNLGISANNDFSMLEKIGGECAGAITFLDESEKLNKTINQYEALNDQTLVELLQKLTYQPLLAGQKNVRLSMAGVQDKLPVHVKNGKFSIPLGSSPSTHILKPINIHFSGLHYNEAFCMTLASACGFLTADAEIKSISGIEFLLIERYDRYLNDGKIVRLHQEDFCQATAIVPERKYQSEGGPSFKNCFALLRHSSVVPVVDLERLIEAVIFNVLVGNCDAHGKNFSLVYGQHGITLAPLYDLVCTTYYKSLTTKMAMKVGKEYDVNKIKLGHFEVLAEQIGFSKAAIRNYVNATTEKVLSVLAEVPITNQIEADIAEIIKYRCERFKANIL